MIVNVLEIEGKNNEITEPYGNVSINISVWDIQSGRVNCRRRNPCVFTGIVELPVIVKFEITFGWRPLTYAVHVSIADPFIVEVIVMASKGSPVGGDLIPLIEKEKTLLVLATRSYIAVTLALLLSPKHWKLYLTF